MARSPMLVNVVFLAMLCMVVVRSPHASEAAMSCGQVVGKLGPCMAYLKGGPGGPPPKCCGGVRTLKSMAQTPADRKAACMCMKNAAAKTKGINYGQANRLASQCGVSISYTFSPNTNCNAVQ